MNITKEEDLAFFINEFSINKQQQKQYEKYYQLIHEYNKVMNLTGIDEKFEVYLKHFYDCLLITKELNKLTNSCLIGDIGSGAGFPGIVLAIYYPQHQFHLIEPLQKRCKFLNIVIEELKLKNVLVLNKRAEDLTREKYDILTSRAVSRLNILLELAIPSLKINGLFLPLKGSKGEEEIQEAQKALEKLNSKIEKIYFEKIPFELSKRVNIKIRKESKTNLKYPRNYSQIKKNPL